MSAVLTKSTTAAGIIGLALALSGCAESRLRLSDDFGHAVRENIVAQVADPDAHYKGIPAPGSSGHRGDLAQQKYNHNAVTRPASTATSSAGNAGGPGGGGGPSN